MTSAWLVIASGNPIEHVVAHKVFAIGSFVFTNHMLMQLIAAAIMVVAFTWTARDYPLVPRGLRLLVESALEMVREGVARPVLKQHTDAYIPFVWTVFFFVLLNNLIGMFPLNPVTGLVTGQWELFGTATSNLSVTGALAAMVFVVTHVSGIVVEIRHQRHHGRALAMAAPMGFVLYWYHLVPPVPGIVGILLFPMLFVLELFGTVIKHCVLAIRLFANIMAGHILLAVLVLLIPVIGGVAQGGLAVTVIGGCVALSCLELLVAFLQAYIFTFLSCMFIGMAVSPEH